MAAETPGRLASARDLWQLRRPGPSRVPAVASQVLLLDPDGVADVKNPGALDVPVHAELVAPNLHDLPQNRGVLLACRRVVVDDSAPWIAPDDSDARRV